MTTTQYCAAADSRDYLYQTSVMCLYQCTRNTGCDVVTSRVDSLILEGLFVKEDC